MRVVLVAACAFVSCFAASIDDQQLNGRWDITVNGLPSPRGWWLEVSGAGTANPKVEFVGSPIELMDEIPRVSISDGELRFAVQAHFRHERSLDKGLYFARFEEGKLRGTFEIEGDPSSYLEWTGARAPVLPEKDDGSWKRGDAQILFDGRDLSGWQPFPSGRSASWAVKDGVLTGFTGAPAFVSDKKFGNFILDAEYRIGVRGDAGVGLRGRYEVQIADDSEKPLSNRSSGAILGRIAPIFPAARPAGEWQMLAVRLVGRQVTVLLNGNRVINRQNIDGLTAIALDANEADAGPLLLQCDRGPVEFRKIVVYPLVKRP